MSEAPAQPSADPAPQDISSEAGSRRLIWLLALLAAVLLALAAVRAFAAQTYYVAGSSMEPVLSAGDRVLIDKGASPQRGELAVVDLRSQPGVDRTPELSAGATGRIAQAATKALGIDLGERSVVARVVGLAGDSVACCTADGAYAVGAGASIPGAQTCTVPPGMVWVVSERPGGALDTRQWVASPGHGLIPEGDIIGTVTTRLWPLTRWGALAAQEATS